MLCGTAERRLLGDLLEYYQKFERPVANEADPVRLKFGLTLQQIMDVVRRDNIVLFCPFHNVPKLLGLYVVVLIPRQLCFGL